MIEDIFEVNMLILSSSLIIGTILLVCGRWRRGVAVTQLGVLTTLLYVGPG